MTKNKIDYGLILTDALLKAGLPWPHAEHVFHPPRRFRFDLCYPDLKIAIEIEGGSYTSPVKCHACGVLVKQRTKTGRLVPMFIGGRHSRAGIGYERDIEKYNLAAIDGWMLLRIHPKMIKDGSAVEVIQRGYDARKHTE